MKAIYYLSDKPIECLVVHTHSHGAVDLAREDEDEPFIRSAPLSTSPLAGHAVLCDASQDDDAVKTQDEQADAPKPAKRGRKPKP